MNRTRQLSQRLGLLTLAFSMSTGELAVAQVTPVSRLQADGTSPSFQASPIDIGDALMTHQRYQAAIEAYKRAPQDSAEAWNKMGVAYQLLRNVNEALRCYRRAAKLNPRSGTYINNIASTQMEHRDYAHAVKSFRKATKFSPENALFEKNLGTALLAEKKYAQGWDAYERAVALDPHIFEHGNDSVLVENPSTIQDRGAMNYYMARACMKAGLHDKAIDFLRMSMNEGFANAKKILNDPQFEPLHNLAAFRRMMEAQGVYLASTSAGPALVH